MHSQFLKLITQTVRLSKPETALCFRYLEPVLYPKNMILEEEGKLGFNPKQPALAVKEALTYLMENKRLF